MQTKQHKAEPVIDKQTIEIHHAEYVAGSNKAEENLQKARETNDFALVKLWERELAFNRSGNVLHTIYWTNLTAPTKSGKPNIDLEKAFTADFGGYDKFNPQLVGATNAV
jgi:superoxide dismutase, Fe-Mn family